MSNVVMGKGRLVLEDGTEVPLKDGPLHLDGGNFDGDTEMLSLPTESTTLEFVIEKPNLELVAFLNGMRLVDASIWWERHLVRGTE